MPELPLVGEEFAGYRLRSKIGMGGMSTVFQAENTRLGNIIALKVLAPELADDDMFRTRFLEESRMAAAMNHPNVIPIHDTGSSGGLLYIAMRYVSGTDLRQIVRKRVRLQPGHAVFLLSQAARALDAAHRRGIVHRDVKPGNLLIERGADLDDPDHVYLADFGIMKPVHDRTGLTFTGQFLGTIDYVAPEQIRGKSVTGAADQYSLGCVLYECLTGRVPFDKELAASIILAHVEEPPAPPTVLCPELPPAIDGVFARVLAKQPEDRYENCRDFMAAAAAALGTSRTPGLVTSDAPRPPLPRPPAGAYPGEFAHDDALARYQATTDLPALIAHEALTSLPSPDQLAGPARFSGPERFAGPDRLGGPAQFGAGAGGYVGGRPPGGAAVQLPDPGDGGRGRRHDRGGQGGAGRGGARRGSRTGRPLLVTVVATVTVLIAGVLVAAITQLGHGGTPAVAGGASTGTSPGAQSSASASASGAGSMNMPGMGGAQTEAPTTLSGVLSVANSTTEGNGLVPPAKCTTHSATYITCAHPTAQIESASFQTYPSLSALYDAYQAEVSSLDGGTFKENTRTCGTTAVGYAEFEWNHQEQHPRIYSVAQMAAGKIPQLNAMGRMACFTHGSSQTIVWTTGVGRMLAVAIGAGSPGAVYNWWAAMHHVLIFPGTQMCGDPDRMTGAPTGNLTMLPTCPSGVAAASR